MEYDPVIGLEVHVQLNTESKLFCSCSTRFGSESNSQTCPVCLGLPGVLPVLNEEALRKGILAGLALNCNIYSYSKFDRKSYFYPDLPKEYQISQYDRPLCGGGFVEIKTDNGLKRIGLIRIHLEEDAGKLIHSEDSKIKTSYVDYNRTGVPLIEIVSEPSIASPDEAYSYLQTLKTIMKYIEVSDCNMEEGSLRCDVNISLRKKGETELGQKVEIKNLNSFKAVKLALEHETERQSEILEEEGTVLQETRLWDTERDETIGMRSKEEAHDYRYFPEPDLPPIVIEERYIDRIRETLGELPSERYNRFISEYNLPEFDAGVLISTKQLSEYFEKVVGQGINAKKASNWIISEMLAYISGEEDLLSFSVTPDRLASLLKLIEDKTISGKIAKSVFDEMIRTGDEAKTIVENKGLKQITDLGSIEAVVDRVIDNNPDPVVDYRCGKEKALKFLVGQVMKETKGKANPQLVNEILLNKLKP